MPLNYQPCLVLRTIPESKISQYKNDIIIDCPSCKTSKVASCQSCILRNKLSDRYYEANIPMDYWDKSISDFKGDKNLTNMYNEYAANPKDSFKNGISLVLKGMHGVGKTFFSSLILKKMVSVGYTALYTTLSDTVNVLTCAKSQDKFDASRELKMVDFLVLDEFDSRFFAATESSADLYGRILESIIRIRLQNNMSTILITNNPDPTKALGDSLGTSISSLISGYVKEVSVIGSDFRKNKK